MARLNNRTHRKLLIVDGVKVRIIVPGQETDAEVVHRASHALQGELLAAGIEIAEYLYRLVDTYRVHDEEALFERSHQPGGLEALIAELRFVEQNDRDSARYPRVKLQDDATGLAITVRAR